MWISEDHTIEDLVKKGVFKPEFFEAHRVSLVSDSSRGIVLISEVAALRKEFLDPAQSKNRMFNYISLANIEPDTGDLLNFEPRQGHEIRSRCKVFHEHDLLYARLRPYLNKCFHATGSVREGICTSECLVIVADKSKVLPGYLRAVLLSKFIREQVKHIQTGSSRPRLQEDAFMALRIPLLTREEQERISKIQDEMVRLRRMKTIEREEILLRSREAIEDGLLGSKIERSNLTNISAREETDL